MSLDPRVLAKVDSRLRSELQKNTSPQMAKVPLSDVQWAVWKRYCDMVGISIGGGLAMLIDHELASVVDQNSESLSDLIELRELAAAERESALAEREAAVAKQEKLLEVREAQMRSKEDALERQQANLDARTPMSRTHRSQQRLGRNEPCWCGSGKKFKLCHGRSS